MFPCCCPSYLAYLLWSRSSTRRFVKSGGRGIFHISEQTPGDEKDARAKPGVAVVHGWTNAPVHCFGTSMMRSCVRRMNCLKGSDVHVNSFEEARLTTVFSQLRHAVRGGGWHKPGAGRKLIVLEDGTNDIHNRALNWQSGEFNLALIHMDIQSLVNTIKRGVAEFREVSQKFLLVGVMDRFDSRSAADAAANPSVSDVEFQFLRRVGIRFFNEKIDQWVKSGDSSVAGVHFVNIWELGGFAEEDLFGRSGNGVHCRYVLTSEQRNQPRATYDPRMKYQNVIREEVQLMIDKNGL
ncbi:hypothetical protein BV898_10321 [Hypsibius exemplaris]|uniref:SGNH hydrolase-type esterase domain-containing protein n=1 Tax=Hypsibius exemplaris TaxID=2072580 RepID=A0A1W0WJS0_HYPEX|nr:hypothetical protein BV898_10321 [Hypsibius exemplaris]